MTTIKQLKSLCDELKDQQSIDSVYSEVSEIVKSSKSNDYTIIFSDSYEDVPFYFQLDHDPTDEEVFKVLHDQWFDELPDDTERFFLLKGKRKLRDLDITAYNKYANQHQDEE